ncbi:MAG: hypothetical protein ACKVW3_16210 [Phycisphaerales bacterium]
MHGAEARRLARTAQIGAVALGVSAAALWALDVPGVSSTPVNKPVMVEPVKPELPTRVAAGDAPERESIAAVAHRLDEAVIKAPAPKVVAEPEPPKEEPAVEPTGPDIQYLGPIFESGRTLAIISIDGTQKIVSAGKKIGSLTFVSADREKLVVEDAAGSREIQRKSRSDARVAWVSNMPSNTPMAAAAVGAGGAAGNPRAAMSPEVAARLRERGIDPEQIQRMRDLARERRRGGNNGGNGNNNGIPGGGPVGATGARLNFMGADGATTTTDGAVSVRGAVRLQTAPKTAPDSETAN